MTTEDARRAPRIALLDDNRKEDLYGLNQLEIFWRNHQPWLKECGYMLRPRYRPDWVRSWQGTDKLPRRCEDGPPHQLMIVIDAVRIRDDMDVCLKRIDVDLHPMEQELGTFLSSRSVANHPRNHCVPLLETLQVPDDEKKIILVMPLLRKFTEPRFDTIGEAVDFFGQVFEGLKFMHDHNVAHRDCNGNNIMMDGSKMYPEGYHPRHPKLKRDFYSGKAKFYTRTQQPPKYYIIDFGISRRYQTRDPPLEMPILGGDKTVPEFRFSEDGAPPKPCDPFPTDVYYLGNMIRYNFTEGAAVYRYRNQLHGFEFMKPLVDDMCANDPEKRPTIDEVIERFAAIRNGLSSWKLRSRVIKASHVPLYHFRSVKYWYRRVGYVLKRTPAIPVLKHP
ncbi:kinase-like domain-containing protein [Mycena galericulata]|nr:kinase-like domain-containing protein [Mycena galericulata]